MGRFLSSFVSTLVGLYNGLENLIINSLKKYDNVIIRKMHEIVIKFNLLNLSNKTINKILLISFIFTMACIAPNYIINTIISVLFAIPSSYMGKMLYEKQQHNADKLRLEQAMNESFNHN